jgi:cobalt-zinc-cadmium resistance protein CzcA
MADSLSSNAPGLSYLSAKTNLLDAAVSIENQKYLPGFSFGYFNQSIEKVDGFEGWQVGINFPIWFWSQSGRKQEAKIELQKANNELYSEKIRLTSAFVQLQTEMLKYQQLIGQYEETTLEQADQILRYSQTTLDEGEMTYFEYVLSISHAYQLKRNYYDLLNSYHQAAVSLDRMSNVNTN